MTPALPAEPHRPPLRVAVLLTGVLLVVVPVPAVPVWAYPIGAAGLAAALTAPVVALIRRWVTARRPTLSRWFPPAQWAGPGTLTATAAIAECAVSRLNAAALAAQGLLLLGYLLLLDAPTGARWTATAQWLRSRGRAALAGVAATGLVLAGLAAAPSVASWILLAGLAAAMAAYLVAVPRHPDHTGEAGDPRALCKTASRVRARRACASDRAQERCPHPHRECGPGRPARVIGPGDGGITPQVMWAARLRIEHSQTHSHQANNFA